MDHEQWPIDGAIDLFKQFIEFYSEFVQQNVRFFDELSSRRTKYKNDFGWFFITFQTSKTTFVLEPIIHFWDESICYVQCIDPGCHFSQIS